ncbi:MAG: folylpolyglutamate synthase/dihydrofolate synthase family protein [Bacteroidota bacterium]
MKYNLDNTIKLMEALANPHKAVKTIHVAGTNGKGSSSHMIASVLQEAGYKTGLYTSPHLKSFTERIRVNGIEIREDAVVEFVKNYKDAIEEIKPSFFEITFVMAMDYFRNEMADYAVIEVGMGGRLDSTNIIHPEICMVTNISFDHQQFLGNTLPVIAGEKAGIFKPGVPAVVSEYQDKVAKVFETKANELGCPISIASKQYFSEQAAGERINIFNNDKLYLEGLKPDLKGSYQEANIIGTIALIDQLNSRVEIEISKEQMRRGLEDVTNNTGLKGRWQVLLEKPLTITDTGHNEAGIKEIIKNFTRVNFDNLHIVWGMVNDKDVNDILTLLPTDAEYYFVQANVPRAMSVERLVTEAKEVGLQGKSYESVMDGYEAAQENANPDDMIFIGGSTFVVAEIEGL